MEMTPSGDQISRLLHVVVIEICQRIVSYTDELVVSGMVFVTADGVEVCRVSFEDAVKGKGRSESNAESRTDNPPFEEDNDKPGFLISSAFVRDSAMPSEYSDNISPCGDHSTGSVWAPAMSSLKGKTVEKTADCFAEESTESGGTDARICKNEEHGLQNGLVVNGGRYASSISNLGEMVMEYWQQITPELLKASTLLCKLGELQRTIEARSVAPYDRHLSSRKLNTCAKQSTQFRAIERGSDWMPVRSYFSKALVSDYRMRNQCRLCQKVFSFATNLIRHQRNFHGRPFSRDSKRANSSKVVLGNRRLFSDLSRCNSHRMNSVAPGECSGHFVPRPNDSLVMERSISSGEVLDQATERKRFTADASFSEADQNSEKEIGEKSVSLVVHHVGDIQECDVQPGVKKTLASDGVNRTFSASADTRQKNGLPGKLKTFDTVQDAVVSTNPTNAECFAFDDCSCWDKNGDSMLDPISVDDCDDNSVHYFDECCSLDGCGPATSVYTSDVLTVTAADGNTFPKTMITDTVTVGSPNSARSVELQELVTKKFNCSSCSASFSMSNNLQRHVKKIHGMPKDGGHSRKVPAFKSALDVLNCESAAELKMTRSSRYRHICVVCGAAFTFRTNLTRHMKKIHHQIPVDVSPAAPRDSSSPRP